MTVDFHTHAFPDAIAERAVNSLAEATGGKYKPFTDGTIDDLKQTIKRNGIDLAVIQPVLTKQSQTVGTNEWAAAQKCDEIEPFGGIYPHSDDYRRDIDFVCSLGLKGIKLHAEYQNFTVDSSEMLKIYDYAFSKGLIIMQHAGFDPAYKPPFRSSPEMFRRVSDELKGGIMIAAHLGGQKQWDDVEKHIAGSNIYIDTSMGFEYYSREQFLRIVEKHGADKILFGSDTPWSDSKSELAKLRSMPLSKEDLSLIESGNARRLLRL